MLKADWLSALLYSMGLTRRTALPGVGAGLAAGEIGRIIQMSLKSSEFRNAYQGLLNAALMGDAQELNKAVIRLDNTISREESK